MPEVGHQDDVTSFVVNYIRGQISSGNWAVGDKIPSENQLRTQLNVSRTSLRSAIKQLAALNILKAKQGVGTFVISSFHNEAIFEHSGKNMAVKKEIVQILEFLKITAPTAIFLELKKFRKCFQGLEKQLMLALEQQRKLAAHDQTQFLQSCFEFHALIFKAIVNEFVRSAVIEAISRLKDAMVALQPSVSTKVILTLHQQLIDAIVDEDPKQARSVLKKLYSYLTAHDYLRHLS